MHKLAEPSPAILKYEASKPPSRLFLFLLKLEFEYLPFKVLARLHNTPQFICISLNNNGPYCFSSFLQRIPTILVPRVHDPLGLGAGDENGSRHVTWELRGILQSLQSLKRDETL